MKLKHPMITTQVGDQTFAIPADDEGSMRKLLTLNDTAAELLRLLQTESTEDDLVRGLQAVYDAEESVLRQDVKAFLTKLEKEDLLQ